MDIEQRDIIELSDYKRYVVVRKVVLDNVNYYYVANVKNLGEVKYLYEKGNRLVQVRDNDVLKRVIAEIAKSIDFDDLLKIVTQKANFE